MSYDWDAIAEALATHDGVMGWGLDVVEPQETLSVYHRDEDTLLTADWQPHLDLNQAVRCGEAVGSWSVNYLYHTGDYRANIHNNPEGDREDLYSQNHTGSPAKAICLAVLLAIGENLSDYEEVSDE